MDTFRHEQLIIAEKVFRQFHGRKPKLDDPVFSHKRNALPWRGSSFSDQVWHAVRRYDMPEWFKAYDARHTAITWLKECGIDPTKVMHYAKHRKMSTQDGYDHTTGLQAEPAYVELDELVRDYKTRKKEAKSEV